MLAIAVQPTLFKIIAVIYVVVIAFLLWANLQHCGQSSVCCDELVACREAMRKYNISVVACYGTSLIDINNDNITISLPRNDFKDTKNDVQLNDDGTLIESWKTPISNTLMSLQQANHNRALDRQRVQHENAAEARIEGLHHQFAQQMEFYQNLTEKQMAFYGKNMEAQIEGLHDRHEQKMKFHEAQIEGLHDRHVQEMEFYRIDTEAQIKGLHDRHVQEMEFYRIDTEAQIKGLHDRHAQQMELLNSQFESTAKRMEDSLDDCKQEVREGKAKLDRWINVSKQEAQDARDVSKQEVQDARTKAEADLAAYKKEAQDAQQKSDKEHKEAMKELRDNPKCECFKHFLRIVGALIEGHWKYIF